MQQSPQMTCPNCGAGMRELRLQDNYGRPLLVDVCDACHGLWFDGTELLQISAGSTIELFRAMSEQAVEARQTSTTMKCPRCGGRLREASDLQRNTRFYYARCPNGHGRFLTFFQFMRAKNFVRTLSPAELRNLRDHIRQINCSNCGAAVDVEQGSSCGFCQTAVSVIDPGQLQATLRELEETEARRQTMDPMLPMRLLEERQRVERAFATENEWVTTLLRQDRPKDLVESCLQAFKVLLR